MIRLPLTLRTLLRLGAHPGPLARVRSALDGTRGYNPEWDGPRIEFGQLVVSVEFAEAAADVLNGLGYPSVAAALHREAAAIVGSAAESA